MVVTAGHTPSLISTPTILGCITYAPQIPVPRNILPPLIRAMASISPGHVFWNLEEGVREGVSVSAYTQSRSAQRRKKSSTSQASGMNKGRDERDGQQVRNKLIVQE